MGHLTQYYADPVMGSVAFQDMGQDEPSTLCQPRDIVVGTIDGTDFAPEPKQLATLKENICVDIRAGQGLPSIGIRKNLKHNF